jgi:hypothetical protein
MFLGSLRKMFDEERKAALSKDKADGIESAADMAVRYGNIQRVLIFQKNYQLFIFQLFDVQ